VAAAGLGTVLLNVVLVGGYSLTKPYFRDHAYGYQGVHVLAEPAVRSDYPDLRYADLYRWTRRSTPRDTVLVAPWIDKDRATLLILSERVPYVIAGHIYNHSLPAFPVRRDRLRRLYAATRPDGRLAALEAIRAELPARTMAVVAPDGAVGLSETLGALASLSFDGAYGTVHLLPPVAPR
jgi:hypothetical protein